ncbi:hypothetical protein COOONC_25775 [Cooperia oncophora]
MASRATEPHRSSFFSAWSSTGSIVAIASSCALGYLAVDWFKLRVAHAEAPTKEKELLPPERKDLPIFKKEDVKKHGKDAESIWVTYKARNLNGIGTVIRGTWVLEQKSGVR